MVAFCPSTTSRHFPARSRVGKPPICIRIRPKAAASFRPPELFANFRLIRQPETSLQAPLERICRAAGPSGSLGEGKAAPSRSVTRRVLSPPSAEVSAPSPVGRSVTLLQSRRLIEQREINAGLQLIVNNCRVNSALWQADAAAAAVRFVKLRNSLGKPQR